MNKLTKLGLTLVVGLGLGLSGCATDAMTGESKISKTAILGLGGAALGAGVGALVSKKNRAKGAAIGAGIGAVAGGGVGAYMDYQNKKLREELQGTGVSVTKNGDEIILNMPDVTFKTGSAVLSPDFDAVLASVAKVLKEYDKTIITVVGYTDSTGNAATNQTLSLSRATIVADTLKAKQKLKEERFVIEGAGATNFIADNKTAAGKAKNRRVEVTLTAITK